jgi:HSP20 family protein
MSIAILAPAAGVQELLQRMDEAFAETTGFPHQLIKSSELAIDLQETEDNIVVMASLPGFMAGDLDIEVSKGGLTIRAVSTADRDATKGAWHLRERRSGSMQRTVTLPTAVYEDDATAVLEHGVLTVTVPKANRKPWRRVKVEAK